MSGFENLLRRRREAVHELSRRRDEIMEADGDLGLTSTVWELETAIDDFLLAYYWMPVETQTISEPARPTISNQLLVAAQLVNQPGRDLISLIKYRGTYESRSEF